MARVATNRSRDSATSTRARSRYSPSTYTANVLLSTVTHSAIRLPSATSPAASPARVPSVIAGNTLLVPVEMGTRGMVQQPRATARLVPSPPKVTRQLMPNSAIRAAARTVSPSV